jgi:hypothetical protein
MQVRLGLRRPINTSLLEGMQNTEKLAEHYQGGLQREFVVLCC